MLNREFWEGTETHPRGREGGREGGGGRRNNQKKRCDIRKHHSKQAKTGGVERISNYKMFSNPVFINPGRNILTEKVFARRDKVN